MIATLRALLNVVKIAFEVSRRQTLLTFCETLSQALAGLNPLYYGLFASGAVARDWRLMSFAIIGLVVNSGFESALQWVGTTARLRQMQEVGSEFFRRFAHTTATIETLEHQENPELLDKVQMFRTGFLSVGGALNGILNLLNTLAFSVATLGVAFYADWRLLILAALGIPRLLLIGRSVTWDKEAEEAGSVHRRLADRLVDMTRNPDAAAEARVFNLRATLLGRISEAAGGWQDADVTRGSKHALLELGNGLFYFGCAAAVIGWLCYDAIQGRVSVGALTIAITSIGALQGISGSIVGTVKWLGQAARAAVRYAWLQDYAAEVHAQHTGKDAPPKHLTTGIELRGVRYRYSGAEADALTDLDLTLPAGRVVALVGENGAGKSTLVKLLTGMYRPSAGQILIDGIDLANLDLMLWRERVSGAFQDHARLELRVGHTVGLGEPGREEDDAHVLRALSDAMATDVVSSLPDGLMTQLGPTWTRGVDLSGGQWQRLAIARGMMRQRPLLRILDEPTAALDAATEHRLFDRYAAAAQQAKEQGGITLLITHRFSTVAAADIVLVFEEGRLTERGSHGDLMAAVGKYAELYELQAKGYR